MQKSIQTLCTVCVLIHKQKYSAHIKRTPPPPKKWREPQKALTFSDTELFGLFSMRGMFILCLPCIFNLLLQCDADVANLGVKGIVGWVEVTGKTAPECHKETSMHVVL